MAKGGLGEQYEDMENGTTLGMLEHTFRKSHLKYWKAQ